MAITISGENNNDKILATDGVIDQISGFSVVGVMTATSFTGDLTGNVTGNLTGNVNSTSPLLLQTGGYERFRITGNNELGIAGANYGSAGQVLTSGGSGSAVTWSAIPSQVSIANNADNRVITGGSGTNLVGESALTFYHAGNDSILTIEGINSAGHAQLTLKTGGTTDHCSINFGDSDDHDAGEIRYTNSSDSLNFDTAGSPRMSLLSSGQLQLPSRTAETNNAIAPDHFVINRSDSTAPLISMGAHSYAQSTSTPGAVISANHRDFIITKNSPNFSGNSPGFWLRGNYISMFAGSSERLRIDSDGDVLVGGHSAPITTYQSSQTRLSIYKSSGSGAYLELGGNLPHNSHSSGTILFVNNDNSDGATNTANGKILAMQRVENVTSDSNAGDDMGGDLVFMTKPEAGILDQGLRITSDGKVLVGDSAVTPSRHLDVRGTGQQQILIGSTNNAGASLMLDGHGGGDGSGGNYGTVEMGSDGNLDIRNYDPAKSIIFGTGSNTGANDSVVIESTGKTRIKNAELSIESSASYTTHLNYNNTGINYISSTNGGATYFRGSNNSITALTVKGDGEVELNTANYKFTENNFLSTSAATVNDATAQFTNAMTSLQGSYHSSNNSDGIMDFTDYKASDWNILDVYGRVNPNRGGSGAYSDPFFMTIYKGIGYTYPNVVTVIFAVMHTPAARTMYSSGTGSSGNNGITAVWYNGSTESREFAYSNSNNAANYLRIKVPTSSFNTTHGHGFTARIFKRF